MNKSPSFTTCRGETFYHWHQCPLGQLLLYGTSNALCGISFPIKNTKPKADWQEEAEPFREACKQLDSYFNSELQTFDLSLAPAGTDFQKSVWRELLKIPFGKTSSYAAIAKKIGNAKAVRAVGGANGRNPIPIIIPCHRVIGSDGSLTGFGGGLPTKHFLLKHEDCDQLALPGLST